MKPNEAQEAPSPVSRSAEPRSAEPGGADPSGAEPDFYYENGCVVFTAAYHRRRGYCCGNNCRHCPYEGDAKRHAPVDRDRQRPA